MKRPPAPIPHLEAIDTRNEKHFGTDVFVLQEKNHRPSMSIYISFDQVRVGHTGLMLLNPQTFPEGADKMTTDDGL